MPVPMTEWDDGSIRVTGTRIPIDSILHHFNLGAVPEQIAYMFDGLLLAQIYGVITYYLSHQEAVDEYLRGQEKADEEGLRFIDQRFDTKGLRERILARRAQMLGKS